jgi:uncharacterized protein
MSQKAKHIAVRTCVVCRNKDDKRRYTRLVRLNDEAADHIMIDPTGKREGRGAYLCDNNTCWQKAADSDVLAKALRTSLTAADRENIRQHKT